MDLDGEVEYLRSNKGGLKLIHNGYIYTVHKQKQNGGIRWRCTQRSQHCKGSISTEEDGYTRINMVHNHVPDRHAVELARCKLQVEDSLPIDPIYSPGGSGSIDPNKLFIREFLANENGPVAQETIESEEYEEEETEVCLQWNSHHSNMKTSLPSLQMREQYVDCTLSAEGKTIKCHKLVLSSCSLYFDEIFRNMPSYQHPVVFLNGVPFWIAQALISFMYAGEVQVERCKLPELLRVAESLQVKGLTRNIKSTPTEPEKPILESNPSSSLVRPVEIRKEKIAPKKQPTIKETRKESLEVIVPQHVEPAPGNLETTSNGKKAMLKKVRKRKLSEHASSPPVLLRKGTKSRPTVKVPRQYHVEYEIMDPMTDDEDADSSLMDMEGEIKTEPLDYEESFNDSQQENSAMVEISDTNGTFVKKDTPKAKIKTAKSLLANKPKRLNKKEETTDANT